MKICYNINYYKMSEYAICSEKGEFVKRILSVILVLTLIASTAIFFSVSTSAVGGADIVYVSATGTDANDGLSADAPVKTLSRAIDMVADNGTICLVGTVSAGESWKAHDKTINITGGTLDFTTMDTRIYLEGDVKFDNVTLNFREGDELYANGHSLYVGENTTLTAKIRVFGGSYGDGTTVNGDANVTLLAGDYIDVHGGGQLASLTGSTTVIVGGTANAKTIRGGGHDGVIGGSTYVWVGDNANPKCDASLHEGDTYYIWGAGFNCAVGGSSTVVFTENAKANYIFGGTEGTDQTVVGGTNVIMSGGTTMSIYGGNAQKDTNSDARIVMTGGTVEQIFGANSSGSLTGNVTIELLGGTVKRRVYGGCYNEYKIISWSSDYMVTGKITIVIGADAKLDLNTNSDRALSAHSRRQKVANEEIGEVVMLNSAAYDKYKSSFKMGVGSGNPYNTMHYRTYTLSGNVITQNCQCGNSATATLTPTNTKYTGKAITVDVTYSETWKGGELTLNYSNNVEVGTASVECTLNGDGVTYNYTIAERVDILYGDVNDDGIIDNNDLARMFKYIYNSKVYSLPVESAADANCDGKINNVDLLIIYKKINGFGA